MKQSLYSRFYVLLEEAWYPNMMTAGICQFNIGHGTSFFVDTQGQSIQCVDGKAKEPTASIHMDKQSFENIVEFPDRFDIRNPDFLSKITMDGDTDFVRSILNLAYRPTAEVEEKIKVFENFHKKKNSPTHEIVRIKEPDVSEAIRLLEDGQPFIATGALHDWDITSWDLDYIREKFGHLNLLPVENGFLTLGEYVDILKNYESEEQRIYTYGCDLPKELEDVFGFPYFKERLELHQIWLGNKSGDSVCTDLHRDCMHSMLCHIMGRKKLVLFPPTDSRYLYPLKNFNYAQTCRITNPLQVDPNEFPFVRTRKTG